MTRAFIALGSNLADPVSQLSSAFEELSRLPGTQLLARSSLWRSAPVGHLDQPDFVNAVAEVETCLAPESLLAHLLDIERRHGRIREFPNAPRTLDLDLLLYGGRCIDEPGLVVPHPRMHLRAFVLDPLAEIAPGLAHPVLGPLAVWRERITDQPIERLT